MTIQNAIKKIEKMTGEKVEEVYGHYRIIKNGRELSFFKNGDSDLAVCFRTRGLKDLDDSMSDYSAGVFWDNVTQAIKSINRA